MGYFDQDYVREITIIYSNSYYHIIREIDGTIIATRSCPQGVVFI